MGALRDFFARMTPKRPIGENSVQVAGLVPRFQDPLGGPTPMGRVTNGNFYEYQFNPRPQPQPGQAYMSPLLRYTEYPKNRIEGNRGSGVAVQRFFKSHEPLTVQVANVPIPSGGSGTIAGQFYSQPLTDTSGAG